MADNSGMMFAMVMVVAVAGAFGFMYFRKGDASIPDASADTGPYNQIIETGGLYPGVLGYPSVGYINYDIDSGRWRRRHRWYPWFTHLRFWGLSGRDLDDFVRWIEDHDRDDNDIERWIKKRLKNRRRDFRDRDWDDYIGRNWSRRESRRYRDRDGREWNKRGGSHDWNDRDRDRDRDRKDRDDRDRNRPLSDDRERDRDVNWNESERWRRYNT